jgi:putative N-acetyltransferase (TIGR04045 family)
VGACEAAKSISGEEQRFMKDVKCKLVETEEEVEKAYSVRHEIFVKEQELFAGSDRDEFDSQAIHIIALLHGEVIGTVRVYEREENVWFGSRLAVLKPFRGRAGKVLIEKAKETVKKRKAKKFMAYVQLPNVPFFRRHRWKSVGDVIDYHGIPHQLMETQL